MPSQFQTCKAYLAHSPSVAQVRLHQILMPLSGFMELALDTSKFTHDEWAEYPDEYWKEHLKTTQKFLEVPRTSTEVSADCTRIVIISDTHGKHRLIHNVPRGDVLVHAGDFTMQGEIGSVGDLGKFFGEIGMPTICIAGNHDLSFHPAFYDENWRCFHRKKADFSGVKDALQNCVYLEDAADVISKGDLVVYGSPWTPKFYDWAFMEERGSKIRKIWDKIPVETDILITHGPPLGRGDLTFHNGHVGCLDLMEKVQKDIKPRVHVFGHIHEGRGCSFDGQTLFVNASSVDIGYGQTRECIVIDVPHDRSKPAMVVNGG